MKGFEEFLKNWSNTVSFFMQFLAIVTNGVVAYVVFRISQNVLKKKDANCFESIIDEIREQVRYMYDLSRYFGEMKPLMDNAVSNSKKGSFLQLLWEFRHKVNNIWVDLPLHKYTFFEPLFDKYSQNSKVRIIKQKYSIKILGNEIKQGIEYLEEAVKIQNQIKQYFGGLDRIVTYNCMESIKPDSKEIDGRMKKATTYLEFKMYLEDNSINENIDWDHSANLWLKVSEEIDRYIDNTNKTIDYINTCKALSTLLQGIIQ